ncbi:MAG TPA: hypothetical protein VGD78_11300 [Chthoniobacterales bacterium]
MPTPCWQRPRPPVKKSLVVNGGNGYLYAMHIGIIHVPFTLMILLVLSGLISYVMWFMSRT